MKISNKISLIIFFITVIPTIIVYFEHAFVESKAYEKSMAKGDGYKATKQYGEVVLFTAIGLGYLGFACFILNAPTYRIPYIVLIVGTIAIFLLWLFRIYGIPILGTDVVIRDIGTDWRDVVTKSCQVIMLPVLTLLAKVRCD